MVECKFGDRCTKGDKCPFLHSHVRAISVLH